MARAKISNKTTAKKTAARTPKKTAAKKTAVKTAARKTVKKTAGPEEGDRYACEVCGLAVTVDSACGCVETAHLLCCDTPMKLKR